MKRLVLLLFFMSGACGLAYQVVWARMMTHVFGTTALAVGTVLAAFMSGLAIGAWLVGKAADRSADPLRLYAWLEFGVAGAALIAHLLLSRITPVYLVLYELFGRSDAVLGIARFALAFVLVMAPTMLMGATLPVLARFVVRRLSGVGVGLSTLYSINTGGAVAGTIVTGFYLIGAFGIHVTAYLAVLGNLAIGVVAWLAAGRAAPVSTPAGEAEARRTDGRPATSPYAPAAYRLLLAGFAISGLTSFAYEIYWTRSLVFLLGNSTYAVTTMLVAFLSGIALGGYLVRFVVDRVTDRLALFGWIQLATGVGSVVALPVLFALADPQSVHVFLGAATGDLGMVFLVRFAVALGVMLVPATLIGATLPLVGRIVVHELKQTGSAVGRIYAVNTAGNVAGALLPGLVLLGWLGIQRGILTMAVLNACVGLVLLATRLGGDPRLRRAVPVAAIGIVIVYSRAPLDFQFPTESQTRWQRVLFYQEGPSATTKVLLDPDTRIKSMSIDGITIGGNGFTDYKQQLLAHLPKLLSDDFSRELSVGLGSAILVGESARHPGVESITCLEIEPSVVAGAALFESESHGVLLDDRLRIVVDDVANHLRTTTETYDVVSADEKTAENYASNGFSFSREYYELLRRRLAERGAVYQWVPTSLPSSQFRMVLRTFTSVFPHALVWYSPPSLIDGPSNTILIGSEHEILPDPAAMQRALAEHAGAFAGLGRYGFTTPEAVLAAFVADGEIVRQAVADAPENTLVHPRYEFYAPADYSQEPWRRALANHDFLMELRRAGRGRLRAAWPDGGGTGRLDDALAAEERFLAAYRQSLSGAPEGEVLTAFESALALAPWNESLRSRIFLQYWLVATRRYNKQELREAAGMMAHALSVHDRHAHARVEYAIVLMGLGALGPAVDEARAAVALEPSLVLGRRVLADALLRSGRPREAASELQALLAIEPGDAAARQALAGLAAVPGGPR